MNGVGECIALLSPVENSFADWFRQADISVLIQFGECIDDSALIQAGMTADLGQLISRHTEMTPILHYVELSGFGARLTAAAHEG